jgi:hypothetical protein
MIDKLIQRAERLEKKNPGSKTAVIAKLKIEHAKHAHHHHHGDHDHHGELHHQHSADQ